MGDNSDHVSCHRIISGGSEVSFLIKSAGESHAQLPY